VAKNGDFKLATDISEYQRSGVLDHDLALVVQRERRDIGEAA
jgi:hypothetical protein